MPTLQIQLLGDFRLLYDSEPVNMAHLVRQQSLLAYLVMHRDSPQSRQHLAFLFWPDTSESQARANLRKAIYDLRKLLPNLDHFVQIEDQFLQWRNTTAMTLDVELFTARLTQAEQASQQEAARVALEQAVTLYTGDLLPACYDDWLLREREQLRQQYVRALEQLIALLEQRRELSSALAYAQRLLQCDPLHESTYRLLMRLHVLNGDRATALRVYHACVTHLQQELGVDPSPDTQQLYQRLLNATTTPSTTPNAMSPSVKAMLPLVGRLPEWKILQSAWHSATTGTAQCVLIAGEAGIGKTRLAEEMLQWAERQGYATARTRSYAAEGRLAYAPITDWLSSDVIRARLPEMDPVWLVEVTRLLPELLVERPDLPSPAPLADSWQRQRFREALARALLLSRQPLLLVIDDLQWCDNETLEWMHYLIRLAAHEPLLVVGTVRSEEAGDNHSLMTLMLDLRQAGRLTDMELGPLSSAETAELASQIMGDDLNEQQAALLYTQTEGHPLFVVEMLRANEKREIASQPVSTAAAVSLPPRVQAVIQSRLAQLSPSAFEIASLAAVVGRAFNVDILAQASRGSEDILVRGLDELWQRRLIREQGDSGYDFSHDRIREVAYAEISRSRQQLLHRRVAQALEAVYTPNLDAVSGRIATHYEQAGVFQLAVHYYERAAEVARRVYANQEAKALYSAAIEASHRVIPSLDESQLLLLYEGRALVCRSLTQLEEAIADFQAMRRLAHDLGNWQKEGESLCQLAYTHWLTFAEDQMPFVEKYALEATECFAQSGDQRILAQSLTMLGAVDQVNRNLVEAGRKLEKALEISRSTRDKEALVQTLSFLCLQAYIQGDFQATVQYAQEGVTVAREVQDGFNELRIQAFHCQGQWSAGNYAQAFSLAHEVMAQAEERGNRFVWGRLLNTLGWFHHEFGDVARAVAYNQESVDMGRSTGINNVEISALVNLGYDYLLLDQPDRALAYFEPTLARVEREGFGAHKWQWRMKMYLGLAEQAYRTSEFEQALRYVEAALEEALATSSQKYVAKGWALRGKILIQIGKFEVGGVDLQRAFVLAEELNAPSLFYTLAYSLGQWHETLGQEGEAAALYTKAKDTVEQMASAVGNEALAAIFLQSEQVRAILESCARTR